jgi:hypothetical protein
MQHRTTLRYTKPLVTRAVHHYWQRTVGIGFPFVLAMLNAFLIWRFYTGNRTWFDGLVAGVVMLGVLIPAGVFIVHYRNSMQKFRQFSHPVAELVADQDTLTISSDRGSSTMNWDVVTEVWGFQTLWLLLFSKSQFVTLPLADVPRPMQAFILERVKAAGGKIAV